MYTLLPKLDLCFATYATTEFIFQCIRLKIPGKSTKTNIVAANLPIIKPICNDIFIDIKFVNATSVVYNLGMTNINFLTAFLGGVTTFFASCLLPLVPTYIAYLGTLSDKGIANRIINSVIFVIGFIFVFMLLGVSSSSLGQLFSQNLSIIKTIGGVLFIFLGLIMLGVIKTREIVIPLPSRLSSLGNLKSFFVGILFGVSWTPCIGPMLAVILLWASQASRTTYGMWLLFAYGLGIGINFVITAILFDRVADTVDRYSKMGRILNYAGAIIIILSGVLLLFDKFGIISIWAIDALGISPQSQ